MKNFSFLKDLKHLKIAKSYNTYKSVQQEAKQSKISYIPPRFTFTLTCKCNLRCPTCQYVLTGAEFFENAGLMKFEDYKSILDRYKKYIKSLTLTGGEVTLHPEMEKFIDYAKSLRLKVNAISNGILIRKKLSAIKKLDDFNITLDAYDEQSFARNRGGTAKQWESIMAGLQKLREDNIKFTISFLATSENIEDLFQLIELADTYQPTTLRLNSINPHSDTRDLVLTKSDPRVMQVITDIMKRTDYSYNIKLPFVFDDQHTYFSDKICVYPWHGAYINEECDVAYCCQLAHDSQIGNICDDYAFNSPKMLRWRKMLMNRKLPVDCRFCHRRFKGDYSKFWTKTNIWEDNDPFK
jgi:MoaA/NifB/PqqE/SkfB family radical SAM enzyme